MEESKKIVHKRQILTYFMQDMKQDVWCVCLVPAYLWWPHLPAVVTADTYPAKITR